MKLKIFEAAEKCGLLGSITGPSEFISIENFARIIRAEAFEEAAIRIKKLAHEENEWSYADIAEFLRQKAKEMKCPSTPSD